MFVTTPPPPGSFFGLPGGSLREGNELREERDGTKEEAHAFDPQGVGGLGLADVVMNACYHLDL